MFSFWAPAPPMDDPIPLTLPKRLSDGETLRLLGNAFDLMVAVLVDRADIAHEADRAGYSHVLSEDQTPSLSLQSFVHAREEHRLVLNTHRYPHDLRQVLHLTIPGGITLEALERFRLRRGFVGSTYPWRDHIYGEWRTGRAPFGRRADRSPVFIELRQDVFQGEPLLLRVDFHRTTTLA